MSTSASPYPRPASSIWLQIASLGWFPLVMLSLALFISSIPIRQANLVASVDPRITQQTGITASGYTGFIIGLSILVAATHTIVSVILFWRRKWDWMALLLSYALITNGVLFPLSLAYPQETAQAGVRMLIDLVIFISLLASISLLFLFPNGRFVPPWTRWLVLAWAIIHLPGIFFPSLPLSLAKWPFYIQLLVLTVFSGTGIAAQIHRFVHISNSTQKQQSKWGVLGLAASALGPFAYYLPFIILPGLGGSDVPNLMFNRIGSQFYAFTFTFQLVGITLFSIIMLLFPISFGIAILKYKLWDIDIFINRALVYGALTGMIVLIYLASVIILEQLIHLITGLDRSEVATALSTIIIAALFSPLQKRVQAGVDRRFYRKKYDLAQTIAAFSNELRSEVDLPTLVEDLLTVVQDTMQPEHVSIWLKPESSDLLPDPSPGRVQA